MSLMHGTHAPAAPARTVVIGAGGFVGKAVVDRLAAGGAAVVPLARHDVDLLAADAAPQLAARLHAGDSVVVTAADAPCKDHAMLMRNVVMMTAMCRAFAVMAPAHVVYVSSDAVYADAPVPLTEESAMTPDSLHGIMHLVRETMLHAALECPLAVLRPTLIYGTDDPHNGYGPNRFRRLAAEGNEIELFGDGEERRDHVLVEDVAEITRLVVLHRSAGSLNVATGTVASFWEIAEMIAAAATCPVAIRGTPRRGPMHHNGYRPFDIAACHAAFPQFRYTPLAEGLQMAQRVPAVA